VLFAGNGIAIQAGYPRWHEIVQIILRELRKREIPIPPKILDRAETMARQGGFDVVADLLQASVKPELLAEILLPVYAVPPRLGPFHQRLRSIPFCGILSTGWDRTLETLFSDVRTVSWPQDPGAVSELLRDPEFFLVKLNGDHRRPETFAFTPDQYRRLLRRDDLFQKFLAHLYSSYNIFFLGTRFSNIETFISELPVWDDTPKRRHFALVEDAPNLDVQAERLRAQYGIELLIYESSPGYPEVEQFLDFLYWQLDPVVQVGPSAPPKGPVPIEPATLDRVTLVNIGPFERLDLDLKADWNVLLGNNGCGKSTILRAIALGFCGDDPKAQESGATLLRVGTGTGSVELQVGNQRFVTHLSRDGRNVRVRSLALTPLQAGRSVILGFPALRGTSARNPSGPTRGGSPNPEVTDLLPLLEGGVDFRLDGAKQWIVNTQLRAEPGNGTSPEEAERFSRMRDTYFRLLGDLTPGVEYRFSRIDRQTWQVFVTTQDGEVPIDTLSQGTSSILGWVGTLLQRMFEIHSKSEHPEQEAALVLVDEIDAHMHPEWQQSIVPLLKKHFPRLQVIATSHSPLIVGNLDSEEVYHLRRLSETGKVSVERLGVSFKGWRADQILTGPAFDLDTTVSQAAQDWMGEYEALYGKTHRAPAEERRLAELKEILRTEIPSHPETPERREALRLIESYMQDQLRGLPRERREKITAEAGSLLAELDAMEKSH
jgi:energy-coupling factor transporter ATP-binding protein EcfA2